VSFSDRQTLSNWQKVGCAIYFAISMVVCFIALSVWMFDGWDEPPMPRWIGVLVFPGTPLIAFAGGCLLMTYFSRDKN
jgi:hypothetical protein